MVRTQAGEHKLFERTYMDIRANKAIVVNILSNPSGEVTAITQCLSLQKKEAKGDLHARQAANRFSL